MEEKQQTSAGNFCVLKNSKGVVFVVLGLAVLLFVLFYSDKLGLGRPPFGPKRVITVTGSANKRLINQVANFTATVESKNADKAKAVAGANQKAEKLVAELKSFGIEAKDLKTQSVNIYREQVAYWEDGIQKYKEGDWNASVSIDIILRDVSRSGDLTELLARAETSSIWGPNYSLGEDEPEKTELLKQAFESAKTKAESLAGGMGMRVGKVISVVEGADYGYVYPMREYGMGAGGGGGMEPGSSVVSTTLTVTFELLR